MHKPNDPLPDFSDVVSGSSSEAMSEARAMPTYDEYTVKGGDSLSKIAKKHYGDMKQWKMIYEANRDIVKNPDLIQIGWVLKLPKV